MRHFIVILILFSGTLGYAQDLLFGRVIDSLDKPVPHVSVLNFTRGNFTVTDDSGVFSIRAAKKDTLVVSSLFYEETKVQVTKKDKNEILIIKVMPRLNELAAVEVTDSMPVVELDVLSYNELLAVQLQSDRKEQYYLYTKETPDAVGLQRLLPFVKRILKKKNDDTVKTIAAKDFDSLFSASTFFTKELLLQQLHIPEEHTYLFYTYCEVSYLELSLLKPENEFLLLDKLVALSTTFLEELKKEE